MNKLSNKTNLINYLNLAPPLGLFLFLTSKSAIAYNLGFGWGISIFIIPLSIYFFINKLPIGFCLNMILFIFVDLSYYLPIYDYVLPSIINFINHMFLIIFWIVMGNILMIRYLFIKPYESNFIQLHIFNKWFFKIPLIITLIGIFSAYILRTIDNLKFSIAFICCQAVGWLFIFFYLSWLNVKGEIDYDSAKSFIREDNQIIIKIRKKDVLVIYMLILFISSFSELTRGLWIFWIISATWLTLIFANLWKVWRYVFI